MLRFGLLLVSCATPLAAQPAASAAPRKDPMQEGLPLAPERTLQFSTTSGHWMSVDVSPDGRTLVFDLLGDLYTLPIGGGSAVPLTRGMAFDAQPRFSPDGKRVVFVSDRDGGWNVWTISLDKKDTVQVSRGKTNQYESPEWTPDGSYIVVTRNTKLHLFHMDGGAGQQLVREPANLRTAGPAFGKDRRYIWHARRFGQWLYNTPLGDYQLAVYDRETGQSVARAQRWGSAFRPALSPDGRWLVYGSRHIDRTGLRLRNLTSGDERWLVMDVQRDDQESRASLDVYPGMSFTPDSKWLIASWSGKLWRVPVEDGNPAEIPFSADVMQAMAPRVQFNYSIPDSTAFVIKQIRDAVPSPDGRRLAFVALDRLYTMDWPAGTPRRVTDMNLGEYHPAWSADGESLVYTTWSAAGGGHLYRVRPDGRSRPQRLTRTAALYQQPVFSPNGSRIVALRGPARAYRESLQGGIAGAAEDLVWIPAAGGDATLIAPAGGLGNPHFAGDSSRIYTYSGARGLVSMRWDGTDQKTHVRVTTTPPPGAGPGPAQGSPALWMEMVPGGDDRVLALVSNDLYIVNVPLVGGPEPTIQVGATPDNASFPVRRLTDIGGQFPAWSADGKRVHWSIGNAHVVYDLERGKAFDDSLRAAQRARGDTAQRARPDTARRDSTGRAGSQPRPQYQPQEIRIRITATRDVPRGSVVLRGARVITMRGAEVLENADVVVRDNRIAGVGARGQVAVPNDARVIDVAGTTIMPGFVDTHAHVRATFDIHRDQIWSYAANLAYGVTAVRDPQTATTDILTYEDQVLAGTLLAPRLYSTGPGVFSASSPTGQDIRDLDHARRILKRYSDYYDTKTIKQYVAGNREQRQWIIQAARELKLMPTTEGSLDIKMNVTEAIDGYSGHEHSWPTFPIQSDLIRLFAESKIAYTPTILVAYGAPWAENYYYATEDLLNDKKLRHFTPWADLEAKIFRRGGGQGPQPNGGQAGWFHPTQHGFKLIGETVRDLIAAGGRAGVGSHGQLQGLGYHWELWSLASGGLSNHDALRVATSMGAEVIGLAQEIGSLEAGKQADLVVLDRNPLENIR
ncbi:MAG: amidohydrolase family protein, partial [Gemmatimonadaceae bacterium]